MTLAMIEHLAKNFMRIYGLKTWSLVFTRSRRQVGLCDFAKQTIRLSSLILPLNDDKVALDAILHEIAHALAGPEAGHGPAWKAVASMIGAKPQRCGEGIVVPPGKWQATCRGCSQVHYRYRRPADGAYNCIACGPDRGNLLWTTN